MRKLILIVLFPFLLFSFSCGYQPMSSDELKEFINNPENEFRKELLIDYYRISITNRPASLILMDHYASSPENEYDSIAAHYDKYYHFIIKLSRNGQPIENAFAQDPANYSIISTYLVRAFADDLQVESRDNCFPIDIYNYVPLYGLTGSTSLLIAIARANIKFEKFSIRINGAKFGFGIQKITFNTNILNNVPDLIKS